jgi:hypothetical protein
MLMGEGVIHYELRDTDLATPDLEKTGRYST